MHVTWLKDRVYSPTLHELTHRAKALVRLCLQRMSTEHLYQALRFAHHRWGPSPESTVQGQEGGCE